MKPETLIYTTKGLIPFERLAVTDVVSGTDNTREIATEWHLDGELVRRDVWVSILRGLSIDGQQANL